MTVLIVLAALGWIAGWLGFIIFDKPDNPLDGMFDVFFGFLAWPLFALGWLVSRPWSR